MFRVGFYVLVCMLLTGLGCHAQSVGYTFKVFTGADYRSFALVAMNHAGSKLFDVTTKTGKSECLLRQGGKQTVISNSKGGYTQCTGLGSNGGIVGYYGANSNPPFHAFAYFDGTFTDVLPNLANATYGNTINAISPNGLMAGTYNPVIQQTYTIFLTYGTSYYSVPLPPDDEILQATGINDGGSFVGQAYYITMWGDYTISYLFAAGRQSEISFPNARVTFAYNINNRGDVVGYYENADNVSHGFIYHASANSYSGPLDVPGATGTRLTGITDSDIVTGSATFADSTRSVAIIGYPPAPVTAHKASTAP